MNKEEFLDKKNTKIHKEILKLFKSEQSNINITNYLNQVKEEYPNLLCGFNNFNVDFKVDYYYQSLLICMVEHLKETGEFHESPDGIKYLITRVK